MRRVALFLAMAFLFFAAGSGWLVLYPPVPRDLGGVEDLDARAEHVRIPVGEHDALDGWLLPSGPRGLIVFFHGYGRDHTRAWRYAQFLRRGGFGVLAVDFRSSRAADRKPTTLGAYEMEDANAVLDWVNQRPALRARPLGLFGESLGGSVAVVLASTRPGVRAVVVDAPFATGRRALEDSSVRWAHLPAWPSAEVARVLGIAFTRHDPFALDAVAAASRLRPRPLLVIYGTHDDRFSESQARDLWRAAGGADDGLWVLNGAVGHNESWLKERGEYERRVLDFYTRHLSTHGGATARARVGSAQAAAHVRTRLP